MAKYNLIATPCDLIDYSGLAYYAERGRRFDVDDFAEFMGITRVGDIDADDIATIHLHLQFRDGSQFLKIDLL